MNKAIFTLVIFFSTTTIAAETLNCDFTIFSAPFMYTVTDINEKRELGETTKAGFFSSGERVVTNKTIEKSDEIYAFELNEGPSEENIKIYVFEDLSAKAINPTAPAGGVAPGVCKFVETE